MASFLYSVGAPFRADQRENIQYFRKFDEARDEALAYVQRHDAIAVLKRHVIEFADVRSPVDVLMMALNGLHETFFNPEREELLEAWGMTSEGKLKRVNLRGARWKKWDFTIK